MRRLGAILLAAGCSSRFGNGNKLLADIDGRPMVRAVAEVILGGASIHEVLVVTGHDNQSIERVLEGLPVRFVFNVGWRDGMGGSISCGVAKLAADLDGALIVPGDMPFLTSRVVDGLGARLGRELLVLVAHALIFRFWHEPDEPQHCREGQLPTQSRHQKEGNAPQGTDVGFGLSATVINRGALYQATLMPNRPA